MSWSRVIYFFFFNDTATTEIYTLSLHDALPISRDDLRRRMDVARDLDVASLRSSERGDGERGAAAREPLDHDLGVVGDGLAVAPLRDRERERRVPRDRKSVV